MFPLPQLDTSASEPIYRQVYESIRIAIENGQLIPGQKIPPTRELAGQLGLNRTTIAAAYELLEAEGLIRGHVGRGSYVAERGIAWEDRFQNSNAAQSQTQASEPKISFASARPAADLFPLEEFRASCDEVIRSPEAASILQLGSPLGYAPLREYLSRRGAAPDDLIVTNGCQQAFDLLQRLFTAPGDAVLIEDPIYPGLKNVFLRAGVRVVGVPVGAEGIDPEAFARLAVRERAHLAVVTPNFQNPTGATMPLDARKALLRAARDAGVVLVENDIYGDLRYEGAALPSLKSLDESGDVLHVNSFSKLAFPGLRVGWVAGPRAVISRLAELKQWTDLHSDQLSQAVLLRFAESGRLAAHRDRMCAAGRERLQAILAACEKHLPAGSRFTRPQGGMSLWVRLPEGLDAGILAESAARAGVSYSPSSYFAVNRSEPGAFRLSFAGLPPASIEAGLSILGRVFKEELERAGVDRPFGLSPAIV